MNERLFRGRDFPRNLIESALRFDLENFAAGAILRDRLLKMLHLDDQLPHLLWHDEPAPILGKRIHRVIDRIRHARRSDVKAMLDASVMFERSSQRAALHDNGAPDLGRLRLKRPFVAGREAGKRPVPTLIPEVGSHGGSLGD